METNYSAYQIIDNKQKSNANLARLSFIQFNFI